MAGAGAQTALACSTRLTPRVWGKSQRFKSDLRSQRQKKKENCKRENGKSKMGDGFQGILATRNPKLRLE